MEVEVGYLNVDDMDDIPERPTEQEEVWGKKLFTETVKEGPQNAPYFVGNEDKIKGEVITSKEFYGNESHSVDPTQQKWPTLDISPEKY